MDLGLAGKLALVTGSTAGIGLATAEALAREGARVIVNGRTSARGYGEQRTAGANGLGRREPLRRANGSRKLIAYVCSANASATTGAALRVDGGVVRAIL